MYISFSTGTCHNHATKFNVKNAKTVTSTACFDSFYLTPEYLIVTLLNNRKTVATNFSMLQSQCNY